MSSQFPQTPATVIYSDGLVLQPWSSWSWGLEYQNSRDSTPSIPINGSHAAYCISVQPFGALSLRTQRPFNANSSTLSFMVRGRGNIGYNDKLGDLEVQLESSEVSGYSISKSIQLRELLKQQSLEDRTDAAQLLRAAESGQWTSIRCRLSTLVEDTMQNKREYDRITIGLCLKERDAGCSQISGNANVCFDRVVILDDDVNIDPLIFGEDILRKIIGFLTPKQILRVHLVSTGWANVASSDDLWRSICKDAWHGKVYLCHENDQTSALSWKQRYLRAEHEKKRTAITSEELISFQWKFRFKRPAGAYWTSSDPYWLNGKDESKMMRRRFTSDFRMIAPPDDPMMSDGESMKWAFVGPDSIRVETFPPLIIKRMPNWGWTMENPWVLMIADLTVGGVHNNGVDVTAITLPLDADGADDVDDGLD